MTSPSLSELFKPVLLPFVLLAMGLINASAFAQSLSANLISKAVTGETANGESQLGAISDDGFKLAFSSTATNMIAAEQADPSLSRIYLFSATSPLQLRQISQGIGATANGSSRTPSLGEFGEHVVFASRASNLIANDNNSFEDIFAVFADEFATAPPDPALTVRLSTNEFGNAPDGDSRSPVISGNGRHVLFESRATNLDVGSGISRSEFDLFVVDRDSNQTGIFDQAGTLRPVRLVQSVTGLISSPAFRGYDISRNGRYVVFSTAFRGVTTDPVSAIYNLYFHDRDTDNDDIFDEPGAVQTTLLGRAANGSALSTDAVDPNISGQADRVLFHSVAAEIQNVCASGTDCSIFVADIPASVPDLVPDPASAALLLGLSGRNGHLSAFGDALVYASNDQSGELTAHLIQTGDSRPVCVSETLRRGNRGCAAGLMGNGFQLAAIESASSNLVPLDTNGRADVFIHNGNGLVAQSPPLGACDDQIDNDGNNLIDLDDPGCYGPEDDVEAPGENVRLVSVSPAPARVGASTILDERGIIGDSPSLAKGSSGLRNAAYTTESNDGNGDFVERIKIRRFDSLGYFTDSLGEGDSPVVKVNSQGTMYLAFRPGRDSDLRRIIRFGIEPFNTFDEIQAPPVSCTPGYEHRFDLAIDSLSNPRLATFENCTNQVNIWRPGQALTQIASANLRNSEDDRLRVDMTPSDELLVAFVDFTEGSNDDTMHLIRTGATDNVIDQRSIQIPASARAGLDVRSDINGAAHVAYLRAYTSTGGGSDQVANPALIYFFEDGNDLRQKQINLDEYPSYGLDVQIAFDEDGLTPQFIFSVGSDNQLRRFVFRNDSFTELQAPQATGFVEQIDLDQASDASIEFVYHDRQSENAVHADPDAAPWEFSSVSLLPNAEVRDAIFSEQGQSVQEPAGPTLLTFSSAAPGGLGSLFLHRRNIEMGTWSADLISAAVQADSADLSSEGQSVAHFNNQDQTLRYFFLPVSNVIEQEVIASVTGFDSIDNVAIARSRESGTSRAAVVAIRRSGDGKSQDLLTAYVRNSTTSQWQAFPFDTATITSIAGAVAVGGLREASGVGTLDDVIYVAYLDDQQPGLHLARFDGSSWSSELVDSDVGASTIGDILSLKVSPERFSTGESRNVPTIAYRTLARDKFRYAMKASNWSIWEYADAAPTGVQIDAVDHRLLNGSRLRPIITTSLSDGTVNLYRRTGGASGDSAATLTADRDIVTSDGSNNGLKLVKMLLRSKPFVAYTSSSGAVVMATGNHVDGLPAARESFAAPRDSDSTNYVNMSVGLCICLFQVAILGTDDDSVCGGSFDGAPRQLAQGVINDPPDEMVLGQWGQLFDRTAAGQRYIDFFLQDYPKIARLAGQDLGLLNDGADAFQNFLPGIQAMVDGYGDQVFLTQDMIDDGLDIWQRLADRDSGSLSAFIQVELAQWNNMQDFVGLSFDEWGTLIGLQVGAVGGDVIFADSFDN